MCVTNRHNMTLAVKVTLNPNTTNQQPSKDGPNTSTKSIDSGQPAQSAQADLDRNFLPKVNFVHIKGPYYLMIHFVVKTGSRSSSDGIAYTRIK